MVSLYTAPPPGSVVVCRDEMGPESAKRFAGDRLVQLGQDDPQRPRRAR
jgi:hypothetical protein